MSPSPKPFQKSIPNPTTSLPDQPAPNSESTAPLAAPPRLDADYLSRLSALPAPVICILYCWSVEDESYHQHQTTDYEMLPGHAANPVDRLDSNDWSNWIEYRRTDRWDVSDCGADYDVHTDCDEARNCRLDAYLLRTDSQQQREQEAQQLRQLQRQQRSQQKADEQMRHAELVRDRLIDLDEQRIMGGVITDLSTIEVMQRRMNAPCAPNQLLPELDDMMEEVQRKSRQRREQSKTIPERQSRQKQPKSHLLRQQVAGCKKLKRRMDGSPLGRIFDQIHLDLHLVIF